MRIIKCSSNNHFYPNISLSKYIYILIYNHAMYIIIVLRESRMIDKMVHPFARLPHQVRKCSMVWNIDGNGGHFGAVSTPVSRFSIGWSRGMLREREREREWASERESERGEGKDETERGLFSWEGVVSAGNEMILEIGPRGASCPRATGHLIRDVVDLLARTYVCKSCKASLASVRARWKFFFFFFFWRGRKLKIYSYRGIWLNWKSVMVFT